METVHTQEHSAMDELEQVGGITDGDLLDAIVEESGHVAPPNDYITVDDYMSRVEAKGGVISRNTALETLLAQKKAGILEGCKMNVGGRRRWVFWSPNHRGDNV